MFKVKAVFEYNSGHDDDLQFNVGQIITVTEEEDADWYAGEYVDESGVKQEGIFPRNFVEKYEPTAPPRPTRTRTKNHPEQQSAASDSPAPAPATPLSPKLPAQEEEHEQHAQAPTANETATAPAPEPAAAPEPTARKSIEIKSPSAAPKPAPAQPAPASAQQPAVTSPPPAKPTASQSKPAGPPPVSEKPSSFKDRIAAFNKGAAPPIAPFKPSGLGAGGSGFIKKPFVAPPPSRNSYIPPVQNAPVAKVYRRDEDPEIKEREAETHESAEKAGLVPGSQGTEAAAGGEDEPKPLSLKERLALLQKQQMEAAQRHADAVAKKEKPKRPAKKRMESHDGHHAEESEASIAPSIPTTTPHVPQQQEQEDVARKQSTDEPHPPRVPHPPRRKSSKGPEPRDGNEADMSGAGETTEGQDDDLTEKEESDHQPKHIATAAKQDDERLDEEEVVDEEDEDEEEEDDVDPEVRRKEELRARMARIAGGMGGMGGMGAIFGGGIPSGVPAAPPKRKKSIAPEASEEAASPSSHAPPVPIMMALPGMSRVKSAEEKPRPQEDEESEDDEEEDDETELRTPHQESGPHFAAKESGGAPPVPGGRPAPPSVPTESRPVPPPPVPAERPPSRGSMSDDELSESAVVEHPPATSQNTRAPPPLPPLAAPPPALPTSPLSPKANRRSYIGDEALPGSPSAAAPPLPTDNRRNSRAPPPVPAGPPAPPPAQSRPPPPPPPAVLSRSSTADTKGPLSPTRHVPHTEHLKEDEEGTEYEGDYDTDIASSAPHKEALKSHQRESSLEDTTSVRSPVTEAPPSLPPPVPSAAAPRGPPPIPSHPPPDSRRSVDAPRAAPPPPPKEAPRYGDDDYDPFNYASPPPIPSMSHPPPPPPPSRPAEDLYQAEATSPYQAPLPERRGPPPAPPSAAPPQRTNTRQSLDVQRQAPATRRSVDMARPSMESGFVANELDLASQSGWWLKPNSVPPQLQGRKDIYFESEESTSTDSRGRTIITRDVYVLFQDYSQTVITVRFNPHDQSDVELKQRHEAPPRTLRQDQLEQSYERFGRAIGEAVSGKQNTVIGDGTPQALVYELLRPHRDALLPVGSRAYGALVYSNLANASTTQNDEIRPGDVISIRNAKFQGKHGPMHAKYSVEVGKPDHVGIVAEWDGTKKKVRAWEQGRESKKVKMESFKLDDLRSGEVKIWRVMPRSWVGWETGGQQQQQQQQGN